MPLTNPDTPLPADSRKLELVLALEDNEFDATILQQKLEMALEGDFEFIWVSSLGEGLRRLEQRRFDLILVDMNLHDSQGLDTVRQVLDSAPDSPVVIHSSQNDPALALECVRLGAQDYLVKGRDDALTLRRVVHHSIERKAFQASALEQEMLLKIFTQHTPAAIAMFDHDLRYLLVSNRWLEDYKLREEDVIGQTHFEVFPGTPSHWHSTFSECMGGKVKRSAEDYVLTSDGVMENIRWEIHPWYKSKEVVGGLIMFTEVITERLAMQKALKDANENLELRVDDRTRELEAATKAKSEFFTNITHELRTPLHAIINFSNFGLKKWQDGDREKLQRYFNDINRSGRRLLWLVDDILDLSKSQSGNFIMDIGHHDIGSIIEDVSAEMQSLLTQNRVKLTIPVLDCEQRIYCDRGRTIQVITNLVSNAIKFSEQNSTISITLDETKLHPQNGHSADGLAVSITDQGSGIPEEELESIFDEFVQSSKVKKGVFSKGTGLGLAICRQIVLAHNGRIWAENTEEGGAKVSFTMPVDEKDILRIPIETGDNP